MLRSAIPVLRAADYPRARAFWTGVLGFEIGEEGGDPPRFGIFHKEGATVFVDAWHMSVECSSVGLRVLMTNQFTMAATISDTYSCASPATISL